jgi:hypothetical protein
VAGGEVQGFAVASDQVNCWSPKMRYWAIIAAWTLLGAAALFQPASPSQAQSATPTDKPSPTLSDPPELRAPQTSAEAGFTVHQAPASGDAQQIIPLAPRVDNVVGSQPVDNPSK